MELLAKILIDYWFKNIDEVIDALEHGERKEGDNIFFENAISTFRESIDLIAYQNRLLQSDKDTIKNLMEQIEKLQMRIDILNKKLFEISLRK